MKNVGLLALLRGDRPSTIHRANEGRQPSGALRGFKLSPPHQSGSHLFTLRERVVGGIAATEGGVAAYSCGMAEKQPVVGSARGCISDNCREIGGRGDDHRGGESPMVSTSPVPSSVCRPHADSPNHGEGMLYPIFASSSLGSRQVSHRTKPMLAELCKQSKDTYSIPVESSVKELK